MDVKESPPPPLLIPRYGREQHNLVMWIFGRLRCEPPPPTSRAISSSWNQLRSNSETVIYQCSGSPLCLSPPGCAFGRCAESYSYCVSVQYQAWLVAGKHWGSGEHTNRGELIRSFARTSILSILWDVITSCRHGGPITGPGAGTKEPTTSRALPQLENGRALDYCASRVSPP